MVKEYFVNHSLDVVRMKRSDYLSPNKVDDETLVAMVQEEIDHFRYDCYWNCNKCNYRIPYSESLSIMDDFYVHELKCPNVIFDKKNRQKKCKTNMVLDRDDNVSFDNDFFNELFARYQDRIIAEASKCKDIDCPYEIYSILVGFFMKIAGKFNRNTSMEKTGERWFASYFWKAVRNKISDIKKTKTYGKRTPGVKCACCGKYVGQITSAHLLGEGHTEIVNKIYETTGLQIINKSGKENSMFGIKEAIRVGRKAFKKMDEDVRKVIFRTEAYNAYGELYPNYPTSNRILSTNNKINEFGDISGGQFEDIYPESSGMFYEDALEQFYRADAVDHIVEVMVRPKIKQFSKYFKKSVSINDRVSIIGSILIDKSSSAKMTNKDLDSSHGGIKCGLTTAVVKFLREKEGEFKTICKQTT